MDHILPLSEVLLDHPPSSHITLNYFLKHKQKHNITTKTPETKKKINKTTPKRKKKHLTVTKPKAHTQNMEYITIWLNPLEPWPTLEWLIHSLSLHWKF